MIQYQESGNQAIRQLGSRSPMAAESRPGDILSLRWSTRGVRRSNPRKAQSTIDSYLYKNSMQCKLEFATL